MVIYHNGNISISIIEENDKDKVLEYFSENNFNCNHRNSYLRKIGFKTVDDIHYIYKRRKLSKETPMFFVSVEDYRKRKQKELESESEKYVKFLKSDIMNKILNI